MIGLPGRWPSRSARSSRPTDPVAATAIMRRLGAPRRIVNVIEGESLVNDATALVAYRVAVAAAVGGSFSAVDAGLEFVGAAVGGIAIGLAVGYVVAEIRRRLDDTPTEITISLLTAYAAFIPADELGLSGVLAAVTAGHLPRLARARDRLAADPPAGLRAVGDPRLPAQRDAVHPDRAAAAGDRGRAPGPQRRRGGRLLGAGLRDGDRMRFVWLFTVPYLIRALDRRPQQRERRVGRAAAHRRRLGRACAARSRSPRRWRCRSRPTPARRSRIAT